MCSRYAETQCCVCRRYLDQTSNRIIVEICGHQKCRECFIKEEDGCSLCVQNKQQFTTDSQSSSHRNSHDVIPSNNESAEIVGDEEISEDVSHIITTNEKEGEVRYKCLICKKSFKSRNNRKYHLFCDKTRSKPFQCKQCDQSFITLAHMNYHQNTHATDKHFMCSHCQRVYSGPIALRKHMKKHQNEFKYHCSQCDEKFLYKEQLNIHENRHNNIYLTCPECGKQFLVKSNLTKHIQSHSGQNRKLCTICKNSFSGNSALKTHMLTHSKAKPYQCEKCSKKFIDQRSCERHSKTHMDNIFFECTLCSAKSGRKDNIRRHVRNLHSESDEELRQILKKIFANFEKKKNKSTGLSVGIIEKKTENLKVLMDTELSVDVTACVQEMSELRKTAQKPIKSPSFVRNIATSVIKFAGRSQDVLSTENDANVHEKQLEISVVESEPIQNEQEEQLIHLTVAEPDSIAEIGVNLPSLNFDPFPEDIAPFPLINSNTNLTVYRQLLSPYLKKQPTTSCDENSKAETNYKSPGSHTKSRPPKKMIEKYEIYRK